ncbi:hypothetical protein PGT21_008058 [Puccinia graminis f. sp. tritici]|uniref:NADH dehydrogenase [ubiquinone] 1 alpha subcomplex subunit n=1 Tax=Puccinia graminis f. sp. tritici TaxID=56615 RepID=A0A5B0RC63_PUCGR|nr:hypothetical protein PGT21_008058 [Puccinia graminis f. sp. tritici]KAA1123257.1 hypothetical protein PGTUg99_016711 [Puccinia graminis f. sp. tritici]
MATPSLARTIKNFLALGPREYIRQLWYICDPKPGAFRGIDEHGNKYYEDPSESMFRNRWVDYKVHDFNASQVPPEWHSWLQHIRKDPPHLDPIVVQSRQSWQMPHVENITGTRGAFKTYSTTLPKVQSWEPRVSERTSS